MRLKFGLLLNGDGNGVLIDVVLIDVVVKPGLTESYVAYINILVDQKVEKIIMHTDYSAINKTLLHKENQAVDYSLEDKTMLVVKICLRIEKLYWILN